VTSYPHSQCLDPFTAVRDARGSGRENGGTFDEIKRTVPIAVNDPSDAELRRKANLIHKLTWGSP